MSKNRNRTKKKMIKIASENVLKKKTLKSRRGQNLFKWVKHCIRKYFMNNKKRD